MGSSTQNAPFFVDNEIIVLTRNGLWVADGTEITHEPTRRLFSRSLRKDGQGWYLQVGRETKRISVEDTAYFIHRIDGSPAEGFVLWINDETKERLDPTTLKYRPGRLTCTLALGEEAKFLHAPYFELLSSLAEDDRSYFLRIGGQRIELASK